jgi:DNA (cytosine-5)-methyltransferase 1
MLKSEILDTLKSRTFVDLFAGAGGTSLGFYWSKWEGVLAIEKDKMAFDSLYNNFITNNAPFPDYSKWPKEIPQEAHEIGSILENEDYVKALHKLKGKIALVMGGPPCQGFSVGGKRDGQDPRNKLVFDMLEVVKIVCPTFVLIENVSGFAKAFKAKPNELTDSTASVVVDLLDELGYDAAYFLLDASDYGVPQSRKRVVTFGIAKTITKGNPIKPLINNYLKRAASELLQQLGYSDGQKVNISDALDDLSGEEYMQCPDAPRFCTSAYLKPASPYAEFMRKGVNGVIPDSHRLAIHSEKLKKLFTEAHKLSKKGRLPQPFLKSMGISSRKKYLLDPYAPSTTVTTHPDEFIHHKLPRIITVREMARLQSFPDSFKFYGRYTLNGERRGLDVSRCAQVGNAVPPLLAKAIAQSLNYLIDDYLNDSIPDMVELADKNITTQLELQL